MTINFKGGSSGMRSMDALAPTPDYGVPQPVLNTAADCNQGNIVWYTEGWKANHVMHSTPDFMPQCGHEVPTSTDCQQQDISNIQPNI